jgi:soluble lytic murein transglycosylase-like protein
MRWARGTTTVRDGVLLATFWASILASPWPANGAAEEVVAALHPAKPAASAADRALPGALARGDVRRYRQIFELQAAGDLDAADRLIAGLGNPLLLGHVLWQRYLHPTAHRSTYAELEAWLERYADHPGADRIHQLALRRQPAGAAPPAAPVPGYLGGSGQDGPELTRVSYQTDRKRSGAEEEAVQAWRLEIERLVGDGLPQLAAVEAERPEVLALVDPVEADLARWTVARGYFSAGEHAKALALAGRAAARSGRVVPEIHWTAGISAWQLAKTRLAGWHFATLAKAAATAPVERSRAAFWAARAYLLAFKPQLVNHFLRQAAAEHDFYGLLAQSVLGNPPRQGADPIGREERAAEVLLRFPGARRALALGQIGEVERAEGEIRKLAGRASAEHIVGLIALAERLDLPAAQMRLAQSLEAREHGYHFGALYPVPSWRPADGYSLDRALIYSIMRAESAFDPSAESHAGARGLMQVMPATARHLASRGALTPPRQDDLLDPETSIRYGQAYLAHLLQRSPIGDNLIYVAAAYNAGPTRVARWREQLAIEDDPLLFLESIPMREPRVYVKKVLTNLWSYRARLGQPQPSLEALARNQWPSYRALDRERPMHAWN